MTLKPKLAFIAALTAASIVSPAFAQTSSHDGSLLPHYLNNSGEIVWGSWGPPTAAIADHQVAQVRAAAPHKLAQSAKRLYMGVPSSPGSFAADPPAFIPDSNSNTPALTGGGSAGYNQNLKNY